MSKKNRTYNAHQYEKAAPIAKAPVKEVTKEQLESKNTNPMNIPWPTDRWGFTRELRKAFISCASKCSGDPDKLELMKATVALGSAFMLNKYTVDNHRRHELMAQAAAGVVPTPKPELKEAPAEPEAEAPESEGEANPEISTEEPSEEALFGDESEMEETEEEPA